MGVDICIICPNYNRAEYFWHKTLDLIHMEFEEDFRRHMLKKFSKYPMQIIFSFGTVYFISEYDYERWSKGRHNVKYLMHYQYEDLILQPLKEKINGIM